MWCSCRTVFNDCIINTSWVRISSNCALYSLTPLFVPFLRLWKTASKWPSLSLYPSLRFPCWHTPTSHTAAPWKPHFLLCGSDVTRSHSLSRHSHAPFFCPQHTHTHTHTHKSNQWANTTFLHFLYRFIFRSWLLQIFSRRRVLLISSYNLPTLVHLLRLLRKWVKQRAKKKKSRRTEQSQKQKKIKKISLWSLFTIQCCVLKKTTKKKEKISCHTGNNIDMAQSMIYFTNERVSRKKKNCTLRFHVWMYRAAETHRGGGEHTSFIHGTPPPMLSQPPSVEKPLHRCVFRAHGPLITCVPCSS